MAQESASCSRCRSSSSSASRPCRSPIRRRRPSCRCSAKFSARRTNKRRSGITMFWWACARGGRSKGRPPFVFLRARFPARLRPWYCQVLPSVIEAIGNTPLVRLDRLVPRAGWSGTILAKLDYLNPGFSKKDRAARGLIEEAERNGAAATRPDGGGADLRQYGDGAGHCLRHQGLSLHCRDVERQFAGTGPEMRALGAQGGAGGSAARTPCRAKSPAAIWSGRERSAAPDRRTLCLPRRSVPPRRRVAGALSWHRFRKFGRKAAARWTPSSISPAPAAPMPG